MASHDGAKCDIKIYHKHTDIVISQASPIPNNTTRLK